MLVVMVMLLAALSVTAAIVTLKSFSYVANTSVKYNVRFGEVGDEATEEINVDESENVMECHVTESSARRNDTQVWTVTDFNRRIQVFKVDRKFPGTVCYVTPLNHPPPHLTTDFSSSLFVSDSARDTDELHFTALDTPVAETSILGTRGQHLCAGVPVYWILPWDFFSLQGEETLPQNVIITYVVHNRSPPRRSGWISRQRRSDSSGSSGRRSRPYQPTVANFTLDVAPRHREHEATVTSSVFRILDRYRRRRRGRRPGSS